MTFAKGVAENLAEASYKIGTLVEAAEDMDDRIEKAEENAKKRKVLKLI